jgi:hypothetical protein
MASRLTCSGVRPNFSAAACSAPGKSGASTVPRKSPFLRMSVTAQVRLCSAGLGGLGIRQAYPIARIREQVGKKKAPPKQGQRTESQQLIS